jgi:hypothetical protein
VKRTMATPASVVTSLDASSRHCSFFPASSTGENPRAGLWFGRWRCSSVVSSWGRRLGGSWSPWCACWSRWWLPLRAWAFRALCTPPSALHGRRILWSGSTPLLTRRLLGAIGWEVHWLVPPGV